MLARIVRMVAAAQRSRAPIQAVADRVSGWFVPLVVLVSIVTFIVWSLVGPDPRMGHALLNAIAVLVIACPCALGGALRRVSSSKMPRALKRSRKSIRWSSTRPAH